MKADSKTEAEVMAAFQRFTDAYARQDLEGVMAGYAPDADVVIFGTEADEKRIGSAEIRAQAERDWANFDDIQFTVGWSSISAAGSVAWLAAEGAFQGKAGGQSMSLPARMTAVFEKRGDDWLMVQGHFSAPQS